MLLLFVLPRKGCFNVLPRKCLVHRVLPHKNATTVCIQRKIYVEIDKF